MMHPHHNLHHQAMSGHPGQHMSPHSHSMPGPGPSHHQMGPPQMHRDQNRMMSQGVGVSVGMRIGAGAGPPTRPPRPLLPPMPQPPTIHHHRPPQPPRHLPHHPQHTMQPPPRAGVMMSMGQPMDNKSILQQQPSMQIHQITPQSNQHNNTIQIQSQHQQHTNNIQSIQQSHQHNNIQIQQQSINTNKQYTNHTNAQQPHNMTQLSPQPHKPHGEPIISTQHKQPTPSQQGANSPSNSNNNSLTTGSSNSQMSPQTSAAPQQSDDEDSLLLSTSLNNSGNVANSKEKTAMCLVNELARFNKIQHQYRLTSEQGPAHRKRFVVSLRLGGGEGGSPVEEYSAEGSRIRAAQHAVAAEALKKTAYPKPPPRPPRAQKNRRTSDPSGSIMPTVELNALTMKLGENAVYTVEGPVGGTVDPKTYRPPTLPIQAYNRNSRYYNQNNKYFNKYPNQYKWGGYSGTYYVKLTVGGQVYRGEGSTPQSARHDAASQALKDLRQWNQDESISQDQSLSQTLSDCTDSGNGDIKSPVSMVHEIALKFNLPVNFDVKSEKGPPHMKVFITTCTVAEHLTEGEGNSKKISKKRAAEKMLEELKKLPSIKKTVNQPDSRKMKRKQQQPKKKTRNLIKVDEKGDSNSASESNPITRLLQWAMSIGGGREPVYVVIGQGEGPGSGGGNSRRRGFTVACEVAGQRTLGSGPSKKISKRDAAQKMIATLGVPAPKTGENEQTENNTSNTSDRQSNTSSSSLNTSTQLTASPGEGGTSGGGASSNNKGRQLAPGLLLVQDHSQQSNAGYLGNKNGVSPQTTAKIAKEFLRAGNSPTADALAKQDHNQRIGSSPGKLASSPMVSSTTPAQSSSSPQTVQVIKPKDQLLYLAQLLGFQVQFTDFPKANHDAFLSLVSLSTQPPLVCHGTGLTTEQSHDQSALAALQSLSQMGLDNVTPSTLQQQQERHPIVNTGNRSNLLTNGLSK